MRFSPPWQIPQRRASDDVEDGDDFGVPVSSNDKVKVVCIAGARIALVDGTLGA